MLSIKPYNSRVKVFANFLLFGLLASAAHAQTIGYSPLGAVVSPGKPIRVSKEIGALLPSHAIVRMMKETHLNKAGETSLVYDMKPEFEPYSHIAIIRDGKRVADFRLASVFPLSVGAEGYALVQAAEFKLPVGDDAFVTAFENIGDGAGTLFVVISNWQGNYRVSWKKGTTQGRFQVLQSGKVRVWNGLDDSECVWCEEHYTIETLEWQDGAFARLQKVTPGHKYSPYSIHNPAIVFEKP